MSIFKKALIGVTFFVVLGDVIVASSGKFSPELIGPLLGGIIILPILLGAYLLPTIVAEQRRHRSALAIFVLNAALGWTFLFWIGALIWACTSNIRTEAEERQRKAVVYDADRAARSFKRVTTAAIIGLSIIALSELGHIIKLHDAATVVTVRH